MAVQTGLMTAEEFERLAGLPENADRRLEYVEGEMVEVVTNSYCSIIASRISGFIFMYLLQHPIGFLTGSDGGYYVGGERYLPDVGFISKTRQPKLPHETYIPVAPDLAVEVISPTDQPKDVRVKVIHYLSAGTTVWVVDPEARTVEVYTPGPRVTVARLDDTVDGGEVLPGFKLAVKDIFAE